MMDSRASQVITILQATKGKALGWPSSQKQIGEAVENG
jgi:hypothetical protein